jgi:hypothetical protein
VYLFYGCQSYKNNRLIEKKILTEYLFMPLPGSDGNGQLFITGYW